MKVVVVILLTVVAWLAESWAAMVAVGVVHSEWLTAMPTVSYHSALLINLAIGLVCTVVGVAKGAIEGAVES